jgi:hypothetical protein
MVRWLYIRLLWAHPAEFRRRFGDEMLEAFDLSAGFRETVRLLADGLLSLSRQWILRSEFRQPAATPAYELITFQQIEPYKPRGIALTEGGLAAMLLLIGIVNAINHGGGHARSLPIGMQRFGLGLIKINRSDLEGKPAVAVEAAKDEDDPMRPFARSYFRILHVLAALDADGDLTISAAEIANAPAALRQLDRNHDGKLSAEECGFLPPGDFTGPPRLLAPHRGAFMRDNPVLAALDTDHDGEISAAEIANSPAALMALDLDHDGNLSPYEVLPHPAASHAAGIIGRFDVSDSGVIFIEGLPKDDPDIDSIRRLLIAADRNRDGLVTRGELVIELASRADMHRLRALENGTKP